MTKKAVLNMLIIAEEKLKERQDKTREISLTITKIEEAIMWLEKDIKK
ncbi:MAG: hypothetical protein ACLSVP_01540 [Fusobacterium sp.]